MVPVASRPTIGCDTAEDTWEEDLLSPCQDHVGHNAHTSKRLKQKLMNRFKKFGGAMPCEPYGYIKPAGAKTLDDRLLEVENEKYRRKLVNGIDPFWRLSRKRTRFPGQHACCWYCGWHYVWGGNGTTANLMCSATREWHCWNSVGFDGELAAQQLVSATTGELYQLDGFDDQFAEMVTQARQNRSGGQAEHMTNAALADAGIHHFRAGRVIQIDGDAAVQGEGGVGRHGGNRRRQQNGDMPLVVAQSAAMQEAAQDPSSRKQTRSRQFIAARIGHLEAAHVSPAHPQKALRKNCLTMLAIGTFHGFPFARARTASRRSWQMICADSLPRCSSV
jgi:hypothetical protein